MAHSSALIQGVKEIKSLPLILRRLILKFWQFRGKGSGESFREKVEFVNGIEKREYEGNEDLVKA